MIAISQAAQLRLCSHPAAVAIAQVQIPELLRFHISVANIHSGMSMTEVSSSGGMIRSMRWLNEIKTEMLTSSVRIQKAASRIRCCGNFTATTMVRM